jgi:hypothetical protein
MLKKNETQQQQAASIEQETLGGVSGGAGAPKVKPDVPKIDTKPFEPPVAHAGGNRGPNDPPPHKADTWAGGDTHSASTTPKDTAPNSNIGGDAGTTPTGAPKPNDGF